MARATRINAQGVYSQKGYDSISLLPPRDIFHKGVEYATHSYADSALICFSILANHPEERFRFSGSNDIPQLRTASLLNLGYLFQNYYYDYAKSYNYYLKALKSAQELGSHTDIAYAYIGMAEIHQHLESSSGATDSPAALLKRACKDALLSEDSYLIRMLAVNLISMEIEKNDTESCRAQIDSLLNFKVTPGYMGQEAIETFCKAHNAMLRHSTAEAIDAINTTYSLSLRESTDMSQALSMFALQNKIDIYKHTDQQDSVISTSKVLLELAKANDSPQYVSKAYKELHHAYRTLNDHCRAREYEFLYLRHSDSLRTASNLMMARDLTFTHQIEEANNTVKDLTAERERHLVIITAISIVALVILLALIYFIRIRAHLRRTNRLLYDRVQELLESTPSTGLMGSDVGGETIHADDVDINRAIMDAEESAQDSRLSNERSEDLYNRALKAIHESPDVYSPDFSIRTLASLIDEPYYAISMAINDHGVNFKSIVTDQRIKEACRRLKDPCCLEHITMDTLSSQLGFKSRTYFTSVFKKLTGLTPTQYVRLAKESQSENE